MTAGRLGVGTVVTHPYSRTVTDMDNLVATLGSLNSAQVHFNVEKARELLGGRFTERIVVGSCVLAIVTGLATAGWGTPYLTERGIEELRFRSPVYAGDTIGAHSEVLEVSDIGSGTGSGSAVLLRTRLTGTNQRQETVVELVRTFSIPAAKAGS